MLKYTEGFTVDSGAVRVAADQTLAKLCKILKADNAVPLCDLSVVVTFSFENVNPIEINSKLPLNLAKWMSVFFYASCLETGGFGDVSSSRRIERMLFLVSV